MIAQMDRVTVVGRRSLAQELLTSLQSLGVVQVDPVEPAEELELKRLELAEDDRNTKEAWTRAVSRSEGLLDSLDAQDVKPANRSDVPSTLDELLSQLDATGKQIDALVAERGEIRDELDVAQTYLPVFRDVAPLLAQFDDSRYLYGTAFAVEGDKVEETLRSIKDDLEDRVAFSTRPRAKDALVVAVALKSDREALKSAISSAGYSELVLPEQYADLGIAKAAHTMEERSQTLPKRLDAINEELGQLSKQHGAKLQTMHMIAQNHQSRFERLEDMAAGKYGFALQGWVPSEDKNKVVEGLRKQFGEDIIVETRQADDHHDHGVPVKLDNPSWVKPFEGLLALFAPPKYGNFDPSWTLAIFFPFFFGLVVGDIGFGLMFAGIAWWMRRRAKQDKNVDLGPLGVVIKPKALFPTTTIIFWCAAWSILFGFIYGEFFGNFLEYWPEERPIFYVPGHEEGYAEESAPGVSEAAGDEDHGGDEGHAPGWIPVLLFRVEVFTPLLLASLGFGILQVLGGWGIRIYYGLKHSDMKHVWEGIGMIGGLVGLIVFATFYLTSGVNTFSLVVLGLGLAIFFAGMFLSGVYLMLIELASNAGNILSYLRLFAVGLSAALVANLATGLGFAISDTLPIIGPILGILVGLTVHLIAIALTIIGHTLQPLRLNYVEFFTKFGFYEESGRPYNPFRLLGGKS